MAQKYKSKWTGPQVDSAVDQITDKIDRSEIGVAGGIASLGSDGKVPSWQLPTVKDVTVDNFIGKDGITIDKAADSEKIEISGKGCVQKDTTPARVIYAHSHDGNPLMLYPQTRDELNEWWIPVYRPNVSGDTVIGNAVLLTDIPKKPYQCANKKYVDDNYVKKTTTSDISVYALNTNGDITKGVMWYGNNAQGNIVSLSHLDQKVPGDNTKYTGDIKPIYNGTVIVPEPTRPYHCANKKYVDEAIAAGTGTLQFKTLFGNQNIVGQGNIDLYKHHVKLTSTSATFTGDFYTDIISSQNFEINSLTDLKTYLGDSFTKDIYGTLEYNNTYRFGCFMTPTTVYYLDTDGAPKSQLISNFTITDTITTI